MNNKIEKQAQKLSEYRYNHTKAVVKFSAELAEIYEVDIANTYTSAMLHDITKENNFDEQLQILNKSDIIVDNAFIECENLIHSMTASIYAKDIIGIDNEDILNAIKYHTTGRAKMSILEKIIYVSDACSYDRHYKGVEKIRELALKDINLAMIKIIEFTLTTLLSKKQYIAQQTIECYNDLI